MNLKNWLFRLLVLSLLLISLTPLKLIANSKDSTEALANQYLNKTKTELLIELLDTKQKLYKSTTEIIELNKKLDDKNREIINLNNDLIGKNNIIIKKNTEISNQVKSKYKMPKLYGTIDIGYSIGTFQNDYFMNSFNVGAEFNYNFWWNLGLFIRLDYYTITNFNAVGGLRLFIY